jgi:DNA-binding CsgD family transcriptional regulator
MRRDTQLLSDLAHQIYDAGVHPERWSQVVAGIAASLDSHQGLLCTPYLGAQHGGLYFVLGIEEKYVQLYGAHYVDQNIWNQNMERRGMWIEGRVFTGDEIVPRREFLASPFYREFLQPQGTAQACTGVVFGGSADLPTTVLHVFREIDEPAFDEQDKEWMRLLVSHISRSLGIMMRLNTARVQNAALLASFDRLSFGVALLNENMQVLHLNQAAQLVLNRRDGIFINSRQQLESKSGPVRTSGQTKAALSESDGVGPARLEATDPSHSHLTGWLTASSEAPITDPQHFMEGCTVARRRQGGAADEIHDNRCYVLQCAPLPRLNGFGDSLPNDARQSGQVRFAVFITDPQAVQLPSPQRLAEIYGLTPMQAKVTCEFASGASYKQVARTLDVSEDTVRAHVKEIYPKMRINRQSDLVRLVLSVSTSGV